MRVRFSSAQMAGGKAGLTSAGATVNAEAKVLTAIPVRKSLAYWPTRNLNMTKAFPFRWGGKLSVPSWMVG
jgi:hypothetical protein